MSSIPSLCFWVSHKQIYLSSEEFRENFGMAKDAFYKLPKWKQNKLKMALYLFWISPYSAFSSASCSLRCMRWNACPAKLYIILVKTTVWLSLNYNWGSILITVLSSCSGGTQILRSERDSISAFLAASAPKKLFFMIGQKQQTNFLIFFPSLASFELVWMSRLAFLLS